MITFKVEYNHYNDRFWEVRAYNGYKSNVIAVYHRKKEADEHAERAEKLTNQA
jgi:hypothetical protein